MFKLPFNSWTSPKLIALSYLQYFSRTDRLLKHKRTCGEAIKKGLDPGMLDLGDEDLGQGSYLHTQGNASAPPRKRGKSKNSGEGGERRRKKTVASGAGQMVGLQDYSIDMATGSGASSSGVGNMADTSMAHQHVRTPKLAFKKGGRKGGDKNLLSMGEAGSSAALHEQKLLPPKSNPMDLPGSGGMDGLGLLHTSSDSKQVGTSSNYDDAMQFLKKKRYLHAANSGGDYSTVHLPPQQTVIQGGIGEPTLALLDTSPLVSVDKHDKSGIPDEVLQSLLDHYSHKSDVTFDLSDPHHVELHAASATPELGADESSSNGSADKSGVMNEYSKFLLQTLERTSHGGSGVFTFFPEKHMYSTSPLECTFGQPVSSPHGPSPVSVLPKSHFSMLVGSQSPSHGSPSSQQAFHLSTLEPSAHQQLTPSQELTEQLDSQELANGSRQKGQQVKNGNATSANSTSSGSTSVYSLASPPDLTALEPSKEVDMRPTFQIENFAQAFGSQFKSERRTPLAYSADPQIVIVEVDPRISRTPVSEFSGYTSLLAEVNEPANSGTKTPTSQSYR